MKTDATPTPRRLIREPDLLRLVGFATSTIRRWEAEGLFPRRIKVSPHAGPYGGVAWDSDEVERWIAERVDARQVA
jgi:predicted DNA-binding transcriptional regulator AlpA